MESLCRAIRHFQRCSVVAERIFLEDLTLDPRLPDRVIFIAAGYLGGLPTHLQVPTMVPVHATATSRGHVARSLEFPHARLLMIRGRLMTYTKDIINKRWSRRATPAEKWKTPLCYSRIMSGRPSDFLIIATSILRGQCSRIKTWSHNRR